MVRENLLEVFRQMVVAASLRPVALQPSLAGHHKIEVAEQKTPTPATRAMPVYVIEQLLASRLRLRNVYVHSNDMSPCGCLNRPCNRPAASVDLDVMICNSAEKSFANAEKGAAFTRCARCALDPERAHVAMRVG